LEAVAGVSRGRCSGEAQLHGEKGKGKKHHWGKRKEKKSSSKGGKKGVYIGQAPKEERGTGSGGEEGKQDDYGVD